MLRAALVGVSLLSVGAAQTTHLVGPGGFAQLRSALAVALPGDTLLVQPGIYAHFTVTSGVTIRATQPGTVVIVYSPAYAPPGCGSTPSCYQAEGATTFAVPAGQTAHVVGLKFDGNPVTLPPAILANVRPYVEVTSGRVTFEGCEFRSHRAQALLVLQATVVLQACYAEGLDYFNGSCGVIAMSATLTVVGGTYRGAPTSFGSAPGGDGLRLTNCVFQGSGLDARGQASFGGSAGSGILAIGGSVDVSDATLGGGGLSGCALATTGVRRAARINALTSPCGSVNDAVLGVLRPGPILTGGTFTLDYRTVPNGFVAIFAGPTLATLVTGVVTPEPQLDLIGLVSAGVVPANGTGAAPASFAVPALPALVGQPFWFQAVTGLSLPLQASPVAGGVMR